MTRRKRTCVVWATGAWCTALGALLLLRATPTTCRDHCFVLCTLQRPRPPRPWPGAPQFASYLPNDGFQRHWQRGGLPVWPRGSLPGECRGWLAWASHRTLCCNHVHAAALPPLEPPLLCTIPCAAGGARGLRLLQRTGATGIRIFIWPRTRVGTRPEHTPLRPQATTPQASGWCVWLQVQHCNVDDGCPPCVSPGAASPPSR
jgi:hypothetical protein